MRISETEQVVNQNTGDDFNAAHEALLVEMLRGALSEFEDYLSIDQRSVLSSIAFMIDKTRQVYDSHGHVDGPKLREALRGFVRKEGHFPSMCTGKMLGFFFSKAEDLITVEVFELKNTDLVKHARAEGMEDGQRDAADDLIRNKAGFGRQFFYSS